MHRIVYESQFKSNLMDIPEPQYSSGFQTTYEFQLSGGYKNPPRIPLY
jgi:hypothetical protein